MRFSHEAGGGFVHPKTDEEKRLFALRKLLLYVHDTVNPIRTKNEEGGVEWGIEFGDWRERLTGSAVEAYQAINAESFPVAVAEGEEPKTEKHFDLEMKVLKEAEDDIEAALKARGVVRPKGVPLWQMLKDGVYADISENIQTLNYFRSIGMQVRRELKILESKPFESFAPKSDKDRWYAANSALVETALVLKLSGLLELSSEDRRLLVEAAMTDHATRRMQYAEKDSSEVSSADYDAFQEDSEHPLVDAGIDPRVVKINRAPSPNFKVAAARGIHPRTPEEKKIFRLQKIEAYVENMVEPFFPNGYKKKPVIEIVDPKAKVNRARARYADIAKETATVPRRALSKSLFSFGNVDAPKFDIESAMTVEFGEEILKEIRKKNPGLDIPKDMPLWELLKREVAKDIAMGEKPRIKGSMRDNTR